MLLRISRARIGFVRYASIPASRQRWRSSTIAAYRAQILALFDNKIPFESNDTFSQFFKILRANEPDTSTEVDLDLLKDDVVRGVIECEKDRDLFIQAHFFFVCKKFIASWECVQ